MNKAEYNKPIKKVVPLYSQGTSVYKNDYDIEQETTNKVSFDIPYGHKATVTIENTNEKGIERKVFVNKSTQDVFKFDNYDDDKEIINRLYIDKIKEEEAMKRELLNEIHIKQAKFLFISVSLIFFSLVGFILFLSLDFVLINPAFYILLFIMGLGWGITAMTSMFRSR